MSDSAEGVLEAMGERATETAKHVAAAASDCCDAWSKQLSECTASTKEFIRNDPLKSILIAAGVGLVLGWLVRR